jgi:RNase P subunit RPR2
MIDCAYCERPLICESCRTPYMPPTQEQYEALSHPDVAVGCPECGTVLVCHWCKASYDGLEEKNLEAPGTPGN